jgi:hypothetical protein
MALRRTHIWLLLILLGVLAILPDASDQRVLIPMGVSSLQEDTDDGDLEMPSSAAAAPVTLAGPLLVSRRGETAATLSERASTATLSVTARIAVYSRLLPSILPTSAPLRI